MNEPITFNSGKLKGSNIIHACTVVRNGPMTMMHVILKKSSAYQTRG